MSRVLSRLFFHFFIGASLPEDRRRAKAEGGRGRLSARPPARRMRSSPRPNARMAGTILHSSPSGNDYSYRDDSRLARGRASLSPSCHGSDPLRSKCDEYSQAAIDRSPSCNGCNLLLSSTYQM
jgi:hypothetical protein